MTEEFSEIDGAVDFNGRTAIVAIDPAHEVFRRQFSSLTRTQIADSTWRPSTAPFDPCRDGAAISTRQP